jgi:excisionase family DNA binding protein
MSSASVPSELQANSTLFDSGAVPDLRLVTIIRLIVRDELGRQSLARSAVAAGIKDGERTDEALSAMPNATSGAASENMVDDPPDAEVMSAEEVAAFLGVDRNTVYEYAGRGLIPCRRLGKRLLFHRPVLVAWLDPSKAASTRKD